MKIIFFIFFVFISCTYSFKIEGFLNQPHGSSNDWMSSAKVLIDGGRFVGHIQQNGNFVISNVPSGSYLVEFHHPVYLFPPIRVEITSKGKIRARKSVPIKPNTVVTVQYPLRITSLGKTQYFQEREQFRTIDLILNPTVLILLAPLLLFMVIPKLADANDPELQKEIQNYNIFNPKQGFPDFSEMLTSMHIGNSQKTPNPNKKATKKKSLGM